MSCTCAETNFMDGKGHDPGCTLYQPMSDARDSKALGAEIEATKDAIRKGIHHWRHTCTNIVKSQISDEWYLVDSLQAEVDQLVSASVAAAKEAEHIRCLNVVEQRIYAQVGPTGGWLTSPKEMFSDIALHMLHLVEQSTLNRMLAEARLEVWKKVHAYNWTDSHKCNPDHNEFECDELVAAQKAVEDLKVSTKPCTHERLNMEGYCMSCGTDKRCG